MGGVFRSGRHGISFYFLRKRIKRQFKTNVLNRFIFYMNLNHGLSVGKDIDENELEKNKDLAEGVEAMF